MSLPEGRSPFAGVPPSVDVLVTGPPLSDKTTLAHRRLAECADQAVVLTVHTPPAKLFDLFTDVGGDVRTLRVVDCSGTGDDVENDRISLGDGPSNLTSAGVLTTSVVAEAEAAAGDGETVGVAVCSLSDLLTYHDAPRVCRFVDALSHRLGNDGFVVGVLNDLMHDASTVDDVTAEFESVVETRTTDDGREMRVPDADGRSPWRSF